MFRVDTECCLFYDYEENRFCPNPAINKTARCAIHQDTANTKFMNILASLNQTETRSGFSLCSEAFRTFNEPKLVNDFLEYAPSLEGALPAFKHGENNLRKCLIAGFKSYKAGYLTSSTIPFRDNFFREQFPLIKSVSTNQWKHAYLSLRVRYYNRVNYYLLYNREKTLYIYNKFFSKISNHVDAMSIMIGKFICRNFWLIVEPTNSIWILRRR